MNKIMLITAIFLVACTSAPKTFESHSPASVITGADNDIPSFQEGLSAQDFRLLITTSLKALDRKCHEPIKTSPVMISTFDNATSNDLDVGLLRRELSDLLSANGFSTVDKFSRSDVAEEISYESEAAGHTEKTKAVVAGRESAIRFLIRTVINSRAETGENHKFVRYRMSLEFVNSETAEITPGCVASAEIRKDYSREKVGW